MIKSESVQDAFELVKNTFASKNKFAIMMDTAVPQTS